MGVSKKKKETIDQQSINNLLMERDQLSQRKKKSLTGQRFRRILMFLDQRAELSQVRLSAQAFFHSSRRPLAAYRSFYRAVRLRCLGIMTSTDGNLMAICKVDNANAPRYPSVSGAIYDSIVVYAVSEV